MITAGSFAAQPQLSWNLVADLRDVLQFPFMVNAFRAGAVVAVLAGLVGWFMVLRRQSFAGHTLAVVGFPGASAAVLLGISAADGWFAAAVLAAIVLSLAPVGRAGLGQSSALTGTVLAFALASGFLFTSLYGGFLSGTDSLLFGSFLGVTGTQVLALAVVCAGSLTVLAVVSRPLLFASVDPDVAAARGVPVRLLSVVFLLLLGVAAAEVSQITGALLVFALLVVPAATAQALTPRPAVGALITVGLGVTVTWLSLVIAYYTPYPIGFLLTSLSFLAYVGAVFVRRLRTAPG